MRHPKDIFPRGLIVSCQALEHEPLHGSHIMARMALAAQQGGAVGIRANTPQDIRAIREMVALPVIGIYKREYEGSEVYITPTFEEARAIAEAGADMIALDATLRPRPKGETLAQLIRRIHEELDLPVMADCSTLEEAVEAAKLGADVVSSTLAGYTTYSRKTEGPDFDLLREMLQFVNVPVIAEGRFHTPEQVAQALAMGCYAVVVGGAITRPQEITARFTAAVRDILG
ncbi:MAG: N-acetylmannosamine-6-phosphate 2-epimerase [Candidatus Sumerlaeaceae bacterium]|nr:N-acetylmannosamine-6-phosphate 2-epimerase [Candidatus Sumerlaeaceae bacterium]